ncbi:hypothetical protein Tco_1115345 [Tanacetum coccineum]
MGKSSHNKKQAMENLNLFYQDIGTSSSADKVELDGKIVKEDEEAVKRIKGEALKEKDDPGAFIFPIRLEGQVRVTIIIAKFLILDIPIDHDALIVVGWGFLCTIGGTVNNPKRLFLTFDGFCHQTFHAARSDVMRNAESDSDDEEEYEIKRNKFRAPIYGPIPAPYLNCNDPAERSMGCDGEIDDMLRISLREAKSNEEIFTSVAWIRAFNINETIYAELCHEFYSTYEFDKVCADDELQNKKIIKFRLGGHAHNLSLLEFSRSLGLYHVDELVEDGFNVYFEGGLRSNEHFNTQEYWTTGYDKIQKNDLWLLSMFDARHQNGYANMAWLIGRWMKRKGADDVVRSLSAPIYCRDLDMTPLKDLIDSEGRLIPEDPQPGVPRVGIPRPPRAYMQDFYDRMGRMEIRQEDIERMEYRQSYHWDR